MKRSVKLARFSLIALGSCLPFPLGAVELPAAPFSRLGSERFAEREKAQDELLEWCRKDPRPAMDELFKRMGSEKDPEVRERCRSLLKELVGDEYLKDGPGFIGVELMDDLVKLPGSKEPRNAVRIRGVEPGSPGDKAGIKVNDIILELDRKDGEEVRTLLRFQEEIKARKANTKVRLKVLRNNEVVEMEFRLGRRPPIPDNLPFDGRNMDLEALEKAGREAHFRLWLEKKKSAG